MFPQFSPFELPKLVSIESLDWAGTALDLVFCALPHGDHAEGDQGGAGQGARRSRWSISRPISAWPISPPMRAGTATSIRRRSCRRRRSTAWSRSIGERIKEARLVANPGCYTTCAQLALIPLLAAKAIDPDEIVIDAKSGMTGAGRAAKEEMLFSEVSEGIHAYGVGHHRHMAELDQEFSPGRRPRGGGELHAASGADEPRHPVDHLCARAAGRSPEDLHAILLKHYANEPFVHVLPFGADAADPPCARLQHDLHRRGQGPHRRAAPSSARRSTIWSRARRARRCRT